MIMNIDLHFGHPNSYDYETLIDQFSGTKINSIRTSSVPLVQFWKNTEKHLYLLFETLHLPAKDVALCFEYPTKPLKGKARTYYLPPKTQEFAGISGEVVSTCPGKNTRN